jgi:hypothetical protein
LNWHISDRKMTAFALSLETSIHSTSSGTIKLITSSFNGLVGWWLETRGKNRWEKGMFWMSQPTTRPEGHSKCVPFFRHEKMIPEITASFHAQMKTRCPATTLRDGDDFGRSETR